MEEYLEMRESQGGSTASETKKKEYFREEGVNTNKYQRKVWPAASAA